jgi:hypothetical protein
MSAAELIRAMLHSTLRRNCATRISTSPAATPRSLRTPQYRVVEFSVAHHGSLRLFSGAAPVRAASTASERGRTM